jgi:carboxypeptidase D
LENNNVMNFDDEYIKTIEHLDKKCGFKEYREKYLVFPPVGHAPPNYFNTTSEAECDIWGNAYLDAYAPNPCFNVYEIGQQCPLLGDILGYPTDLQYSYPGYDNSIYFNRTDVKKAMHAPLDVEWLECKGPVFIGEGGPQDEGDLSADPIQKVLPRVIEATNRVVIANGALDFDIITNGTLLAIQNMTWGGKLGFQTAPSTPINITLPDLQYEAVFVSSGFEGLDAVQGIMGKQHYERGLMWAQTSLSGHMEPQFQPRSSYRHLQWLLGHIEKL